MSENKPFIDKESETVPLMYKGVQIGTAEIDYKNNKMISKITAPIGKILEIMEEMENMDVSIRND